MIASRSAQHRRASYGVWDVDPATPAQARVLFWRGAGRVPERVLK